MKKKILISMGLFSFIFLVGGVYLIISIETATSTLDNIIKLHQIEIIREHLLLQIRQVQSDLYLRNTRHARGTATIRTNMKNLSEMSNVCFKCHHPEALEKELLGVKNNIEKYNEKLSSIIAMSSDDSALAQEEEAAAQLGENLIKKVNSMVRFSNMRLQQKTRVSYQKIGRMKLILYILVPLGPLLALGIGFFFIRGITKPINSVLDATRSLKAGNLDYRIEGLKDEFGELEASFNEMAHSLNEQMNQMQRAEQMTVVGEMAASIAHELKNPLTGIKIALQMLLENKNLTESESEIAYASFSQIKRMESLIKEVLDFARPKEPEYSKTDINALVEKTVSFIGAVSSQSNGHSSVEVVKSLGAAVPEIMVDPMQIQQAVMNVVLNAYDAMPEGGTLGVSTSLNDSSVIISVSDTGQGIPGKDMAKMFKPFFTTKVKGTGLGLPIIKGIIERHGGRIELESCFGEGTTVTLALPLTYAGPQGNIINADAVEEQL
jgi:signal transduction histidine kinase